MHPDERWAVSIAGPVKSLDLLPGVQVWPERLNRDAQKLLVEEILELAQRAPFYRPQMPKSGKLFSVEETNFGLLGWVSDSAGYRYEKLHPVTGNPWPPIPLPLLELWAEHARCPATPECCLVNLYRNGARMGLHQDRDESTLEAPVLSLSLGDEAIFRIGNTNRRGPTKAIRLRSGDLVAFGGPARLAFHGIDRVVAGTSGLISGGGRLNLTLRRVSAFRP
jgi:DNA oxidative demethylase